MNRFKEEISAPGVVLVRDRLDVWVNYSSDILTKGFNPLNFCFWIVVLTWYKYRCCYGRFSFDRSSEENNPGSL